MSEVRSFDNPVGVAVLDSEFFSGIHWRFRDPMDSGASSGIEDSSHFLRSYVEGET